MGHDKVDHGKHAADVRAVSDASDVAGMQGAVDAILHNADLAMSRIENAVQEARASLDHLRANAADVVAGASTSGPKSHGAP